MLKVIIYSKYFVSNTEYLLSNPKRPGFGLTNFVSPNESCHNLIKNKNYYNVILKMTSQKWDGSYIGGMGIYMAE